ncbi:MAG: portal protein [Rhodospirillales bacterium]|nr:portal protein [Rhodospirillales bacterium]
MDAAKPNGLSARQVLDGWRRAQARRAPWESLWRECRELSLPHHGSTGTKTASPLFDGTAPDAVDQLAASLLANLTPPWARWFALEPDADCDAQTRDLLSPVLDHAGQTLKSHFDRSNLAVELHQCFLDLVTVGTACLLMEEAPVGGGIGGGDSAFTFCAVPIGQSAFAEGAGGRLDTAYRRSDLTIARIRARFPRADLPTALIERSRREPDTTFGVIEAVVPDDAGYGPGFKYAAVLDAGEGSMGAAESPLLARGRFASSPFIAFRWLKAPGESYGRSPVMKALPDIKTANKVVELTLKNASIAVTGIWQADDDGVLNPATIRLAPGAIIPKAVGSAGLTPLEAPGRFDVSQLILTDLRARIRHALLADRLDQVNAPRMTATEVLERAAEMARLLGATYGRLQSELLTPLVMRGLSILTRRGAIDPVAGGGAGMTIAYTSPLARQQSALEAHAAMQWLESVAALGPEGAAVVDKTATARWLARAWGVPDGLLLPETNPLVDGLTEILTETLTDTIAEGLAHEG